MKKILLLCCFMTIYSSLKAMDYTQAPLEKVITEKAWSELINRMLNGTVTSQELYTYDQSLFQGQGVDSNRWPLYALLAYYLGETLDEKNDGHGGFSYTHTRYTKRYLNIIEQLITMDKIRMPDDLTDTLANNQLTKPRAIESARLCKEIGDRVKMNLDQINRAKDLQHWRNIAMYMNRSSLHVAYVMHLSAEQKGKVITKLQKIASDSSIDIVKEYNNRICTELSLKEPLGSHAPHNENKTFFNTVTQKCLGLATLCIMIGIVTYKYYTSSSENEDTDEKEQEQTRAAYNP